MSTEQDIVVMKEVTEELVTHILGLYGHIFDLQGQVLALQQRVADGEYSLTRFEQTLRGYRLLGS